MYFRKYMSDQKVFGRTIGLILGHYDITPMVIQNHHYIFLNLDEKVIKCPFYVRYLVKHYERKEG